MKIVKEPDKLLREISEPVKIFNHALRLFIEGMKDTCYKEGGAGLSAVQVGLAVRVLIYALDSGLDRFGSMVNPVIKYANYKKTSIISEGCLSVPNKLIPISRPESILVSYQDGHGHKKTKKIAGIKARIILHEIDHLNGKLITDYE